MINWKQLDKWKQGLRATFPVVGAMRRRAAVDALEKNRNDPAVIPLLAEAVALRDTEAVNRARQALASLEAPKAIDALCALWAKGRDKRLGAIIAERGYVAVEPAPVRVVSGLKAGATDVLAEGGAELARALVAALDDSDSTVSQNAGAVLRGLQNQQAIDALCALWAKGRDKRLGAIIAERGYVAVEPVNVRILSGLKCGKRIPVDHPNFARAVAGLLRDVDEVLRAGAENSLRKASPGPAVDTLCDVAIHEPGGPAAKLCLEAGFRPSDHEQLCLFLFVTRQLDAYFTEDFEFQELRLAYDRADAAVQSHVMEVVRSGDRRCLGFFGTRARPLPECTEPEIKLALESCLRHRDWPRLFHACLDLPLKHGFPALAALRRSNWEPEPADLRSVYKQVLADAGDQELPPPKKPSAASPLFEQWLARGHSGELANLDEAALIKRLKTAIPPDGVAIVGALAGKRPLSAAVIKAVQDSPHWLVRLAGHAAGIQPHDLTRNGVRDTNYWIGELASAAGVLEFWPGKATPADLEKLSAAPEEAWTGRLGAARKVLRTIMTHRITTGTFEPMVIQAGEFAGEFVQAIEVEFETE